MLQTLVDTVSIKGKAMIYREEIIEVIYTENKEKKNLILKRLCYRDEKNRHYVFISNNLEIDSSEIALIYKKRWRIELLFKKMKQNFQLSYFYGENENAIRTQIWRHSYSSSAALVSFLDVIELIQNTKRAWKIQTSKVMATTLFDT